MRDSDLRMEAETVVQWNQTDEPVSVYTANKNNWRKMDRCFEAENVSMFEGKITGKSYLVPQNCVTISIRTKARTVNRVSFNATDNVESP